MEEHVNKYKEKIARLEVSVKKISALETHLEKKGDELKEKINIPIKKIIAIKAMVGRTISQEIDFSDMKDNEIHGKFLEIETLIKDIDVIFNKTISDIEKVVGKRLVIKNKRKD